MLQRAVPPASSPAASTAAATGPGPCPVPGPAAATAQAVCAAAARALCASSRQASPPAPSPAAPMMAATRMPPAAAVPPPRPRPVPRAPRRTGPSHRPPARQRSWWPGHWLLPRPRSPLFSGPRAAAGGPAAAVLPLPPRSRPRPRTPRRGEAKDKQSLDEGVGRTAAPNKPDDGLAECAGTGCSTDSLRCNSCRPRWAAPTARGTRAVPQHAASLAPSSSVATAAQAIVAAAPRLAAPPAPAAGSGHGPGHARCGAPGRPASLEPGSQRRR